ncbi:MAG TPA: hypothetical protein VNZ45_11770 [Bacteroidia bacterium]|nr:hypothetical protein [Bacteroidia bacterium]
MPASPVPIVGGNNNTWGTILNQFLAYSLDVTNGQLLTGTTNQNYTNFPSLYPNANWGTNPNYASGSTPGIIALTGDLAGTAASPALASIVTAGTVGSSSLVPVITYDAKGRITATSTASISGGTQRTFAFFAG